MTIRNVHERPLSATPATIGALLDQLASLPTRRGHDRWPLMRLDRGPQVGATGGHGPIRYLVDRYQPGITIAFRFTAPLGLHGQHRFEVLPRSTATDCATCSRGARAGGCACCGRCRTTRSTTRSSKTASKAPSTL